MHCDVSLGFASRALGQKEPQTITPGNRSRVLVVEEAKLRVHEGDPVLAARLFDLTVAGRAAGLGDEAHAVLLGVVDVVAEGNEAVRDEGDAVELVRSTRFFCARRSVSASSLPSIASLPERLSSKRVRSPSMKRTRQLILSWRFDARLEGEAEHLGVGDPGARGQPCCLRAWCSRRDFAGPRRCRSSGPRGRSRRSSTGCT